MVGGVEVIAPVRGLLGRERTLTFMGAFILLAVLLLVVSRLAWGLPLAENRVADAENEAAAEVAGLQDEATAQQQGLSLACKLDVPAIFQYPELPTGCESVALVSALQYAGFDVEKTEIASNWLSRSDVDFVNAFMGDPFDVSGHSCMAPALTSAANAYLEQQSSTLGATDITGASFTDVLAKVSAGTPVVVWCTIDLADPGAAYAVAYENGFEYALYADSHCVVLSGYDLEANIVYVSDPLAGQVAYPLDTFAQRYYQLGSQAVVIE